MGQVIQTNGDYNIKTREGSRIILDTGPNIGEVFVTGNLVIQGDTLAVTTENLNIQDNVIVVNKGETGSGVTLRYSGLKVDRGPTTSNVGIIWDELISSWVFYSGSESDFVVDSNSKLTLRELRVDPNVFNGNLFINITTGVIEVPNSVNYESRVVEDNHIPNKRYVDFSIQNNPTFQIRAPESQDSRVIIADKDVPSLDPNNPTLGSLAYHEDVIGHPTNGESVASVIIDNSLIGQFFTNRFEVGNLALGSGINKNEITSKASTANQNIFVKTQGTGKLQTNYALQFNHISGTPASVSNSSLIYAKSPGIGNTGVWFTNDSNVPHSRDGELISKNKALVFSMIF
jgi:hypothetical protein